LDELSTVHGLKAGEIIGFKAGGQSRPTRKSL